MSLLAKQHNFKIYIGAVKAKVPKVTCSFQYWSSYTDFVVMLIATATFFALFRLVEFSLKALFLQSSDSVVAIATFLSNWPP